MRVLIVDDTPDVRALVRAAVERAGHEVVDEAFDGRHAIALAAAHQPDAVILDGMMPVLSGLDALPELRRLLPDARIVMFSSIPDDRGLARLSGADAYVNKGDGLAALIAALQGDTPR